MSKSYHLKLWKHQIDTLLVGLRYLELHHPMEGKENLKPDFRKLLTEIYKQLKSYSDLFKD